ncbi:DNA-binding protein [Methylobacterium amylolyticum]|uniref:DNA-binding protein n=1 Tax=Methylobacterium sp. NEAU 140 TaxID=3064945 RepID=UPI002734CF8B|nr:DNA-binding protein [Methylobacterium sp. NEAU 140]
MIALRIRDIAKPNGPFGRTKLFADIAAGRLVARKVGRSTVILADDWRKYLEGIPRASAA